MARAGNARRIARLSAGILVATIFCLAANGCGDRKMQHIEDNLIVCIGDSLTTGYELSEQSFPKRLQESMPDYRIVSLAENAAVNGCDFAKGWPCIPDQLDPALALNPEYVVFWGGSNGIESQTADDAVDAWKAIADGIRASPATGIFLTIYRPDYNRYEPPVKKMEDLHALMTKAQQQNLSVGEYVLQSGIARGDENRKALNGFIVEYVEKHHRRSNVVAIETNDFLTVDGTLDPRFDAGDGIHLNEEGHRVVAEIIESTIRGIEQER
jgi:lysophospholipase L1-like esterase